MSKQIKFPKWIPPDLVAWFKEHEIVTDKYDRFIYDDRMRDVWEWFEQGRPHYTMKIWTKDPSGEPLLITEESPKSSGFLVCLSMATRYPGKPSNMTPGDRAKYLAKVRKHAEALMTLLQGTIFDAHIFHYGAESIDPELLEETVVKEIQSMVSWSRSEGGGILVAYETDDDGEVYKHGWNYPNSALVNTLNDLIEWAKMDDYYDILHSVKPIRHSGISGRKTSYLASLYSKLTREGVEMPLRHYATATNVALELPIAQELDEESASKQIQRIVERQGKPIRKPDREEDCPF